MNQLLLPVGAESAAAPSVEGAGGPGATPPGDRKEMQRLVRRLLCRLARPHAGGERRAAGRLPFPMLVELSPVDSRTGRVSGESLVVVGKNLSERGLGFFHQGPLPFRRAVVKITDGNSEPLSLLIDISWCRYTQRGWYDSGGRFLRAM